jgi:TolB-like protein
LSLFNELKRRNVFKVTIAYVVMAWLVMQVADVILNNVEAPGWVFHVILLLLGIGLLFAIFFAWAYELTPEGIKKEKDVDRTQSITKKTGRKLDFTIIGVMALAITYFTYDKFVLSASRDAALVEATTQTVSEQVASEEVSAESDNSIAVLPFINMSSDEEQEYFSDGLSEELLNLLAKIPELRVTSRSSAFAFKGEKIDIQEVAKKLNVAHILEGSVRKAGNQVRITAQLIETSSDTHLW